MAVPLPDQVGVSLGLRNLLPLASGLIWKPAGSGRARKSGQVVRATGCPGTIGYSSMRNHDPSPTAISFRHLITVGSDASQVKRSLAPVSPIDSKLVPKSRPLPTVELRKKDHADVGQGTVPPVTARRAERWGEVWSAAGPGSNRTGHTRFRKPLRPDQADGAAGSLLEQSSTPPRTLKRPEEGGHLAGCSAWHQS
jgi:hypothetical protein